VSFELYLRYVYLNRDKVAKDPGQFSPYAFALKLDQEAERIIGRGFWIKVRDFERSFYDRTVIDAARFLRREIF
jgi:hypothetical protein